MISTSRLRRARKTARGSFAFETLEPRVYLAADPVFELHSNPGANHTIYLDFDGHITEGTTWNGAYGITTINSPPYDIDGNPSNFGATELARVQDVWEIVSEDFVPFNVNVTTEDPGPNALRYSGGGDTQWGVRVVITDDTFANCGCGGHAYIGSFDDPTDEPVFVYNSSLTGVAEASSHEVGHAMILAHDGTLSGATYYSGHGSGQTSWGTLMGASYNRNVTQWSKGEYFDANNNGSGANYGNGADDLAVVTSLSNGNGFGYRSDDHGDTSATATALSVSGLNVSNAGIVETTTDADVFSFNTGAGNVQLDIDTVQQGPNLDIRAELRDSNGNLVAVSDSASVLDANFNLTLAAGQYFLHVTGTGTGNPLVSPPSGYTEYASLGRFFVSGTVVDPGPTAPMVSVTASDPDAAEAGQDPGEFTISRSGTNGNLTVLFTMNGSATEGVDYDPLSGSVVIPDGQGSTVVTITPVNDSLPEGNETAELVISPNASYILGTATASVTISDNDMPDVDDHAISESTLNGSVVSGSDANTVTSDNVYEVIQEQLYAGNKRTRLEHRWTFDVTGGSSVTFSVEAHHDSAVEHFDFDYSTDGSAWTNMLTVTNSADNDVPQTYDMPSTLSGTVFVRVIDTDRSRNENDVDRISIDNMLIRSSNGGGSTLPQVSIVAADPAAAEQGQDPGLFTVSRTGDNVGELVVNYSIGGSANNGADYGALSGSATIPDGDSSATIQVVPVDDTASEGNETVVLTLTPNAAYTLLPASSDMVTIADNDVVGADHYADSESSVYGTVVNDRTATEVDDDIQYEEITEELYAGNKRSRLEHRWTFDVTGGNNVTFNVNAYHDSNVEDIDFEYSTDGSNWNTIFRLTSNTETTESRPLPNTLSGTVHVRVVDTDRGKDASLDTVYIDEMFIRSDNAGEPEPLDVELEVQDLHEQAGREHADHLGHEHGHDHNHHDDLHLGESLRDDLLGLVAASLRSAQPRERLQFTGLVHADAISDVVQNSQPTPERIELTRGLDIAMDRTLRDARAKDERYAVAVTTIDEVLATDDWKDILAI